MPAYLDYAATAPLRPAARAAWLAHADAPSNPASLHGTGRRASEALEQARDRIAELAGTSAGEVIWTSGGTESDAIALRGLARRGSRVLVGATEHKAVLDTVKALPGVQVRVLGVQTDGRLDLADLEASLGPDVGFAAVMAANNETGAVNDLAAIRELCTRAGVAWHCDAVQWPATRAEAIGADTVAYSAHKLGGPVGVGALVVRKGLDLPVYSHGGGQEAGIRSGTVNVAGAAAFAAAWTDADERRDVERARIGALRDRLQAGIVAAFADAAINGGGDRLVSHLNVTFPACPADSLLMLLDRAGVEVSAGSACSAGIPQPSHVLVAMGLDARAARESLRFSLGWAHDTGGRGQGAGSRRRGGPAAAGRRSPRERPMRVLAAVSGGVDSAVAMARAVDAGHDVTAVHLALARDPQRNRTGSRGCCSIEDSMDARRAAAKLGVPFYVWDLSEEFAEAVIDDFIAQYQAGRTPNPCVRCNERIKFAAVLERGRAMGFDAVATGHYARRVDGPDGPQLHRAADPAKDQSYVLGVLSADQLPHCLFPLGDSHKGQVRAEAARRGLAVAAKPDSHDICFIPDGDTAGWLRRHGGDRSGDIVDAASGEVVGAHHGTHTVTDRAAPRTGPGPGAG